MGTTWTRVLGAVIGGLFVATCAAMDAVAQDRYAIDRARMIDEIARTVRETRAETGRAALPDAVVEALRQVPRHRLVPPGEEPDAYRNVPLAIGHGQTISQPFIVALMTDLLDVKPGDKVLEVGTGSGYQAAVLAQMGAKVYTIEIVEPLGKRAAERLAELGYRDVVTRIGDGFRGWPEAAPFDSIIVTAAPTEVPPALVEQVKAGGRIVIPIGASGGVQTLYVMEKERDGTLTRRRVLDVRFVPLTGEAERRR